ncbi:hypothetical protein LCGC14_1333930 [marine sediment metagenome]|uniref:Uncharacterized protein n=1 Tax=marine sediment metagenome TaxID=412755 RepID=A0A0F9MWK0_9ZZZZ
MALEEAKCPKCKVKLRIIELERDNEVIIRGKGSRGGIKEESIIIFKNPQERLSKYIKNS